MAYIINLRKLVKACRASTLSKPMVRTSIESSCFKDCSMNDNDGDA